MSFFLWLEASPIGLWVSQSTYGFAICLTLHAWAMAFLVGYCLLLATSVYGMMPRALGPLLTYKTRILLPSFLLSLLSGFLLLSAYPETTLSNPVFYVKLALVILSLILALTLMHRCQQLNADPDRAVSMPLKLHAAGMLLAWFATIAAGRLLYYAYSYFIQW